MQAMFGLKAIYFPKSLLNRMAAREVMVKMEAMEKMAEMGVVLTI